MKAFALTMVAMPPRCTGSPVRSGEPPQWCSRIVGHARKGAAAGSLSTRNRAVTLAVLVVATSGRIVESAMRNRDVPRAPIWKISRAMPKTDPKAYYTCLGGEPFATADQIRAAYHRCAKQWHPDLDPSPGAQARFQAISEAYQALSSPRRRTAYDGFGAQFGWWAQSGRWTRFQSIRCDTGIPSRVIRLSTAQPTRASVFWAGRVRARRPRPMTAL